MMAVSCKIVASAKHFTTFVRKNSTGASAMVSAAKEKTPDIWAPGKVFEEKFNAVREEIFETCLNETSFPGASGRSLADRLKKVIRYNISSEKERSQSGSIVNAYRILEKPEHLTMQSLHLAYVLGVCMEIVNSSLFMLDDIIDDAEYRWSKTSWYQLPEVGKQLALSDINMMMALQYQVINEYFGAKPYHNQMLHELNKVMAYVNYGQIIDYAACQSSLKRDFSKFTMEEYDDIVKHKTAYFGCILPLRLGMFLTQGTDEPIESLESICVSFGKLLQMQNDYSDVFWDFSTTGKDGTDIRNGKCSWLAVTALQRCDAAQRAVFTECYASNKPGHVERVLQIYEDLQLDKVYKEESVRLYAQINAQIDSLRNDNFKVYFPYIQNVVYDLQKV